jgi:hypothetical protein
MPTVDSAKEAIKILRELEVGVPGPPDPLKGEHAVLFNFIIQVRERKITHP